MTIAQQKWFALATPSRKAFWEGRHVFITGGFGLLGSTITELLHLMGARITLLQRDQVPSSRLWETEASKHVNIVRGDILSYEDVYRTIAEYEVDTVIHLAAQPIAPVGNRAPLPTINMNVMGTANVLEACRTNPTVKRVVVASSDKAYGAQPVLPYTEDAPLQGRHPYDVSKSCTDLIAQMYYHTYKLPVAVTRCGNLYGPGDLNWQRIVPETIKHLLHGEKPVIRSDGKFIRDYFFVRDAANGYLHIAENMGNPEVVGQAFNLSTGNGKTVLSIVDSLSKAVGRSDLEPTILNEAKAEIHEQTLSSEKALRILGWQPVFTLEEGLEETVSWYKDYFTKRGNLPSSTSASSPTIPSLLSHLPTMIQEVVASAAPVSPAPLVNPALPTPQATSIEGVTLTTLKIIADDRGQVMHMLRQDSPAFQRFGKFGEVYFSGVYSGVVKGWKIHSRSWSNWSVPSGRVKATLYDARETSPTRGQTFEVVLGDHNYQLLTIPPGVAAAWKGFSPTMSLVANFASETHDPEEGKTVPLETYPYKA